MACRWSPQHVRVGIGTRKAHIGIDLPCCQLRIGIANNLMIHILVIGNMYRYIGEWHLWLVIGAMFADAGRANFFDMFASFPHK